MTSLAAIERLKEERPNAIKNCVATAGFSLGEITALIFAGALGFEKGICGFLCNLQLHSTALGLQLVQIRAEAMQLASETHQGGMLTVFYGADSKLTFACKQAKQWAVDKGDNVPECKISTYLSPNCKVVAGSESVRADFHEPRQGLRLDFNLHRPSSIWRQTTKSTS